MRSGTWIPFQPQSIKYHFLIYCANETVNQGQNLPKKKNPWKSLARVLPLNLLFWSSRDLNYKEVNSCSTLSYHPSHMKIRWGVAEWCSIQRSQHHMTSHSLFILSKPSLLCKVRIKVAPKWGFNKIRNTEPGTE